jgi:uncharacterized Zn finger protein (UPF0148 family)
MRLNHRTIRDDRGQRVHVPVRSMRLLDRHSRAERVVIEYYDEFGMRRQALNSVFVSVGTPLLLICFGIFVLSFVYDSAKENSLGWTVFNITVGVTLIVAGLSHRYFEQRAMNQLTRRRHLLPRLCPQCHYDLSGVPQESDGCTLCPECGAAWNLWDPQSGQHAIIHVVDDRSQRISLMKPVDSAINAVIEHRYQWLKTAPKRKRWEWYMSSKPLRVLVGFVCAAVCGVFIRAAWFAMPDTGYGFEMTGTLWTLGTFAAIFAILGLLLGVFPRVLAVESKVVSPMAEQACAACLTDLTKVSVEDDGCTVCPTCKAAWRLRS